MNYEESANPVGYVSKLKSTSVTKRTASFFAPLWGIDDPEIERAIRREALRRYSGLGHALLLMLGGGVFGVVFHFALLRRWGPNGIWISGLFAFPVWDWLLNKWMLFRARKLLPSILQSMGRCSTCGYMLERKPNSVCPECGSANSLPQA
ncbi:MAG TPA: hypothetical protein VJZ71_10865 [Phycisphaerae bacterium]|nr:hypothetical protein [Phycisphaerae bacterium]